MTKLYLKVTELHFLIIKQYLLQIKMENLLLPKLHLITDNISHRDEICSLVNDDATSIDKSKSSRGRWSMTPKAGDHKVHRLSCFIIKTHFNWGSIFLYLNLIVSSKTKSFLLRIQLFQGHYKTSDLYNVFGDFYLKNRLLY